MINVKTISHTVGKMTHPTFRVAKGKKREKIIFWLFRTGKTGVVELE